MLDEPWINEAPRSPTLVPRVRGAPPSIEGKASNWWGIWCQWRSPLPRNPDGRLRALQRPLHSSL